MRAVLADLALDREGALALGMRMARAFVSGPALARIGVGSGEVPCQQALRVAFVAEAMEALGGMGYVEDTACRCSTARRVERDLGGSGNVICLDILRSWARPECRAALESALDSGLGADTGYDRARRAFGGKVAREVPESEPGDLLKRLPCSSRLTR